MTTPPKRPGPDPKTSRAIGLAMLGSAIALATVAALAYARVLPVAEAQRGWIAAGVGLAAVIDALIGTYFLRASSQS